MKTKDDGQQWADENAEGRKLADETFNKLAETPERLPHAVNQIREMAARTDGVSAGYLARLAMRAI